MERALPPVTGALDIVASELGDQTGAIGATTMARHRSTADYAPS